MANEITFTGSLTAFKASVMSTALARAVTAVNFTMTGNFVVYNTFAVTTAAVAIPLGSVTAPHWSFFYNTDPTNFVRLHNGSGGAKVVKLKAGEMAFFPWDDTATPYGTADTATCNVEYLILSL